MSTDSNGNVAVAKSGGVGFAGLLTILFIALKLTGVITWSWLWVLSPLWISFLLGVGIFVSVLVIAALVMILVAIFDN